MNKHNTKWFYLIILSFIWGSSYILIKKSLLGFSPLQLGSLRIIITAFVLFVLGFNSLKKIKTLPKDTKIYFGHEYTLQNSNFCIAYDSENLQLKNKIIKIKENLKNGLPTVPTILDDEIQCNIFLKAKDLQTFSKLRDLRDNF